ncbi:MAG: hypothetical protein GXP36_11345 [Actinobacteria bacterium]|nr:hypothetical protein [Actinomycetota bacterium]
MTVPAVRSGYPVVLVADVPLCGGTRDVPERTPGLADVEYPTTRPPASFRAER